MAEITCPMCGKPNPADQAVCQYCEARLKPLTDELSRSQPPIHPGEEPTDRDTGELESILPQWLRDIRQQGRESAGEESEQPPVAKRAGQQGEKSDLLAGLQSQSEGNEEVPDWLAGLRSEGEQVNFEETSGDEDDLAALKSMLGEQAPAPQEDESSALPAWLADLDKDEMPSSFAQGGTEEALQAEPEAPASSSDLGWTADFETGSTSEGAPPESGTSFDTELPAWLQESSQTPAEGDAQAPTAESDLPAWLASLGAEETGETAPPEEAESQIKSTADWLASLGKEETEEIRAQEPEESAATGDLPDWLATLGAEETGEILPQEPVQPSGEFKAPDWPSSLGEEETTEAEQEVAADAELLEPSQADTEAEIPDWLATMGEAAEETEEPAEELETPTFAAGIEADKPAATPTFVDDEGKPISSEDVDAIFSMDMPDWLSDADRTAEKEAAPIEIRIQRG